VCIAEVLIGPSKQLKQIFQIGHNIVKNLNWPKANQLAVYKRGWEFELGATGRQIQVVVRAGLEPGTADLLPSCQPNIQSFDCIIVIWENRHEKDEDSYAW